MKKSTLILSILFMSLTGFAQDSYNNWHCPDSKLYPPINIRSWRNTPVINGRLPTYPETQNGLSLMYYDKKKNPDAKPYNMTLPKLASFYNPNTKRIDIVVVIQIVQTANDTIAGYRYLTGGDGTHNFRDFHLLTDNEVKKLVVQKN